MTEGQEGPITDNMAERKEIVQQHSIPCMAEIKIFMKAIMFFNTMADIWTINYKANTMTEILIIGLQREHHCVNSKNELQTENSGRN